MSWTAPNATWAVGDIYTAAAANVLANDLTVLANAGWVGISATLTYSSTDGHTFVASTGADLTGSINVGARVQLTDTGTQYFIVTAISATTITLYGGTSYSLSGGAITNPAYSNFKAPPSFSLDPTKWTEQLSDTSSRTQANPVTSTWYNPGSLSLAIPIGAWHVQYFCSLYATATVDVKCSLSTSASSESDADFSAFCSQQTNPVQAPTTRRKDLVPASKTTYYLICQSDNSGGAGSIGFRGDIAKTIIRAVCAYL